MFQNREAQDTFYQKHKQYFPTITHTNDLTIIDWGGQTPKILNRAVLFDAIKHQNFDAVSLIATTGQRSNLAKATQQYMNDSGMYKPIVQLSPKYEDEKTTARFIGGNAPRGKASYPLQIGADFTAVISKQEREAVANQILNLTGNPTKVDNQEMKRLVRLANKNKVLTTDAIGFQNEVNACRDWYGVDQVDVIDVTNVRETISHWEGPVYPLLPVLEQLALPKNEPIHFYSTFGTGERAYSWEHALQQSSYSNIRLHNVVPTMHPLDKENVEKNRSKLEKLIVGSFRSPEMALTQAPSITVSNHDIDSARKAAKKLNISESYEDSGIIALAALHNVPAGRKIIEITGGYQNQRIPDQVKPMAKL